MQMKCHVLALPGVLQTGISHRGRHRPTSCWRHVTIPQQSRHSTPYQLAVAFPVVLLRIDSAPARWLHPARFGATGGSPSGPHVPSGLVLRLLYSSEGGRTLIRPAHGPAATARRPSSPSAAVAHNMAASGKPAGRVVSVMLL